MSDIPDVIYLQVDGSKGIWDGWDSEVTLGEDRINEADVKYVRVPEVDLISGDLDDEIRKLEAELRKRVVEHGLEPGTFHIKIEVVED